MGPLAGLDIVEMAGLGPCPLAGQLLADLGAKVTVIDRKSNVDLSWDVNRRGKRSVAINCKNEQGRAVALAMIGSVDVLIEGFRPGVMERMGLGPEDCIAVNPKLVYGRMTGWGQDGPLAQSAGHDINYLSITGALHAMGEADRPPSPPLNLVADYGGGAMFLVLGVLAGVFEAGRSGRGQVVDAAMVDGVPAMMGLLHSLLANGGWSHQRASNMLDGGAPYYRCYETADGRFVSVGALEPQFFAELVEILGLDPAWNKTRLDPANWPELTETLVKAFGTKSRDEWAALFLGRDACVAPVLDWSEATRFAHNTQRGVFNDEGGISQAAPAPRFSRSKSDLPSPAGQSGAHNEMVLAELGYGLDQIESLKKAGALT